MRNISKAAICLELGQFHRIAEPRTLKRLPAEGISAGPGEAVPIGDREAQVVGEGLAHDLPRGVVVAKREGVGRVRAFVGQRRDTLEEIGHVSPSDCGLRRAVSRVGFGIGIDKPPIGLDDPSPVGIGYVEVAISAPYTFCSHEASRAPGKAAPKSPASGKNDRMHIQCP